MRMKLKENKLYFNNMLIDDDRTKKSKNSEVSYISMTESQACINLYESCNRN
jgi:hypothetical protein